MDRIANWIAQIDSTVCAVDSEPDAPRPSKQPRRSGSSNTSSETDFAYAFNMAAPIDHTVPIAPASPVPSTPSKSQAPLKRAADSELRDSVPDLDLTPRPSRSQQSPKRRRPSKSPEKKTKKSAHTLLNRLEKPFFEGTTRPRDVPEIQALDQRLRQITRSVRIVPSCIRDLVQHILDDIFEDSQFHDSDDTAAAETELRQLVSIVDESDRSDSKQRNEDAWNNLVHTPVLQLAFPPAQQSPELQRLLARMGKDTPPPKAPSATVRYEPMMSATIIFDSIPRLELPYAKGDEDESILAVSCVSGRSAVRSAATDESIDETNAHTRAGSKKVDYCLAVDLERGDPLERVLWELTQSEINEPPHPPLHTSQTTLRAVQDNLLPVAIETKQNQASTDPLEQLGIWTAAFHRRMQRLRMARGLAILGGHGQPEQTSSRERLVPLPLIIVRGSTWNLMYALDQGDKIEITKATTIGSTSNLLAVYQLLASLRALGDWVETDFYKAMREWFAV